MKTIKEEYEIKKQRLITEIKKSFEKFEKETGTYITKILINPKNKIASHPDAFGEFPISKRYFVFLIKSTIDTDEIQEIENNLYFKEIEECQ